MLGCTARKVTALSIYRTPFLCDRVVTFRVVEAPSGTNLDQEKVGACHFSRLIFVQLVPLLSEVNNDVFLRAYIIVSEININTHGSIYFFMQNISQSWNAIDRHQMSAPALFTCEYCDFTTRIKFSLNRHLRLHTGHMFQCPNCRKQYNDRSKLKNHIEMKHHGKRFVCNLCGKIYKSADGLVYHKIYGKH